MGIKSLKKLLKKQCPNGIYETNISQFSNNIIFIDTSIFLYKFKHIELTYKIPIINSFINMIFRLYKHNITPFFVFDGKPTKNKIVIQERIQRKEKIDNQIYQLTNEIEMIKTEITQNEVKEELKEQIELTDSVEMMINEKEDKIKKLKIQNLRVNSSDIHKLKELLKSLSINYIHKECEADLIIPYIISSYNLKPALCISDDTDFIVHNVNLISKFDYKTGVIEYLDCKKILEDLQVTQEQFVEMCVLMGCDYCSSIKGIGPMKSYKIIKKHKTMDNYLKSINKDNYEFKNAKNMFLIPLEIEIEKINFSKIQINDKFTEICDKYEVNLQVKNKIIDLEKKTKINYITNYFNKIKS